MSSKFPPPPQLLDIQITFNMFKDHALYFRNEKEQAKMIL